MNRHLSILLPFIITLTLLAFTQCKNDDTHLNNNTEINTDTDTNKDTEDTKQPEKGTIKTFCFLSKDNSEQLNQDVYGTINGHDITVRIPYTCSSKQFKPYIELSSPQLYIKDSKETYDFSEPVNITIATPEGLETKYNINVVLFTGLPILCIQTTDNQPVVSKDNYLTGSYTLYGDGVTTKLSGELQIRGRGNSTWGMPKKPYQIKFDKKTSPFGWPLGKVFVLLANYSDKTKLRTTVAFQMSNMTQLEWTPRSEYVELVLNGEYQGIYQLCEKIKTDANRVNVGKNGYILEADQLERLDPDDVYFTTQRQLFNIKEPELTEGDAAYNKIKDYVTACENALYSDDFLDAENGYKKYIDLESFADWYLVNEITRNNDAIFYSSVYLNKTADGKLKMGPVWDFDISMGNIDYNNNWETEGWWIRNSKWIERLFLDPEFLQLVRTKYEALYNNRYQLIELITRDADYLKYSASEDDDKWHTLNNYTWPNYVVLGSYDKEVQYLKEWLLKRMDWMKASL